MLKSTCWLARKPTNVTPIIFVLCILRLLSIWSQRKAWQIIQLSQHCESNPSFIFRPKLAKCPKNNHECSLSRNLKATRLLAWRGYEPNWKCRFQGLFICLESLIGRTNLKWAKKVKLQMDKMSHIQTWVSEALRSVNSAISWRATAPSRRAPSWNQATMFQHHPATSACICCLWRPDDAPARHEKSEWIHVRFNFRGFLSSWMASN